MPTQTGRFVDELVRRYLHPPLKVCGFRRRVRTWNRAAADLVHVVQLQASAWNMGESGSFTVNLGVSMKGRTQPAGPIRTSTRVPPGTGVKVPEAMGRNELRVLSFL